MADNRAKAVLGKLSDLSSRTNYLVDLTANLAEPLAKGDIVDVPSISSLTVISDLSTDGSAQTVTTNATTLTCNLQPGILCALPMLSQIQIMDGSWAEQVAMEGMKQLKNYMDSQYAAYLLSQTSSITGVYSDNIDGGALAVADIVNCQAALLANDGVVFDNLAWMIHPYGQAAITSIAAFIPNYTQAPQQGGADSVLGIKPIGTLYGNPVYISNSVPRRRTIASTAWSITSNVLTVTVAAGHCVTVGMRCTFDTVTAGGDMATVTACTSVTSTTIVFSWTASNGSATEAGTLTVEQCENLLIDRSQCFVAQQKTPTVRIVPAQLNTGDILQVSSVWGRVARVGRVRALISPVSGG